MVQSKTLDHDSLSKSMKLDNDETEMASAGLGQRSSPCREESSTPNQLPTMGLRIVVSLPEMPSPGDSSAEEDEEDSDFGDSSAEANQFSNLAISLPNSVQEEVEEDDLSPRSISMHEAEEGREGKQGMEKLLLERLLARKELRLTAMQEKVKLQGARLREVESRLTLLETIPGFFFFQWLGFLLLRLTVVLKKLCRANHLLLGLCKLNKLLLLPFSRFLINPEIANAEDEMDTRSLVPDEEEDLSKGNFQIPEHYGEGESTKQRPCSVKQDFYSEHICFT